MVEFPTESDLSGKDDKIKLIAEILIHKDFPVGSEEEDNLILGFLDHPDLKPLNLTKEEVLAKAEEIRKEDLEKKKNDEYEYERKNSRYYYLLKSVDAESIYSLMQNKPENIYSGFNIGGEKLFLPSGAISIFAGATGHGKTSFLINLALNFAENKENLGEIHFFSYEESKEAITLKALNAFMNTKNLSEKMDNNKAIELHFRTKTHSHFKDASKFNEKLILFFALLHEKIRFHYVDYSVEELIESIKYIHKHSKIDAILIDYIQLLRMLEKSGSRQEELKEICLRLKDCAVETGLPIVLGSQFNRTVTNKAAMHRTAIGEAGDIERIAALVCGLWNDSVKDYIDKQEVSNSGTGQTITLKILKGREMKEGEESSFIFNGETRKISSIEPNNMRLSSADSLTKKWTK